MARCCYTEKGTRAMSFDEKLEEARDGEGSMKINEMEQTKVSLMRTYVESQDPSSRDPSSQKADDLMIRRFLRARDLDVEKASALFLRYLKWRQTFVPNGSISLSQVRNEVAQNKMFLQGLDKQGRPISVVLGAKHFQYQGSLDEFKRCHQDRRSLLLLEILKDGDIQIVICAHTLELYPFCRTTTLKDLGSCLLFMHLTYLWQYGKLFTHLSTKIPRRRSCLWRRQS
ncbi:uncharacterized protein LOC100247551 isoform X4 [Vitis vinifera]|uniref:uncharacterized protein LOC100247551 isoform X4 n=1 Tax=Vitis vinifera TaxID=29760 RepID=UPI0028831A42|nr:uncharacterized protein LOC100247551 isoform X4 [Vitis vinifera]